MQDIGKTEMPFLPLLKIMKILNQAYWQSFNNDDCFIGLMVDKGFLMFSGDRETMH